MLLQCPECALPVSDKALTCPHCGFPLKSSSEKSNRGKFKKRMRLPNGFGRITELKNKPLRNPFRAMITVGFDENGRPIGKILGYYKTYNDAYSALAEYHKHPVDLDKRITVQELYERWTDKYFEEISPTSKRTITSAWAYCSSVYTLPASDLRARHIKYCMEEGIVNIKGEVRTPSASTKARIKSLFNLMLDFAVEFEIVEKNYARTFEISGDILKEREEAKRQHLSFTEAEMNVLWENIDNPTVQLILLHCYTGWRPQELVKLKLEDVNIIEMTMKGGMKTEAGTDRIVPIHSKVQEIAKKIYHMFGSRPFFVCDEKGKPMTYDKYRHRFDKVIAELGLNPEHRPHDCRKQFVTTAKKYNLDEYAIKRLVGHSISDITERVYTDRGISWLRDELEKMQ